MVFWQIVVTYIVDVRNTFFCARMVGLAVHALCLWYFVEAAVVYLVRLSLIRKGKLQ